MLSVQGCVLPELLQNTLVSDFSPTRLIGLDLVRGGAILTVLFAHARFLTETPGDWLFLSISGKFGVELFFVLSGFLIGAILIRACEKELSFRSLWRFWTRRWLRTLPAYFGVLLFVWAAFGEVDILYFLFLQDLVIGNWDILPVSWTLVIEEWFYLLFPPTCFVLIYFMPRLGFVIAAALLLFSSLVLSFADYGACAADARPLICFENEIRKFTFRFTSLGMGAMLAYVHHRWDLHRLLMPHLYAMKWITAILVILVLGFCGDLVLNFPGNAVPVAWAFALFYPLMGIASVSLIALMYVWEPKPAHWVGVFFTFTSVTSYSCYLWHLILRDQVKLYMGDMNQFIAVGIFLVLSLIAGGISYKIVEQPFLRLRDRLAS